MYCSNSRRACTLGLSGVGRRGIVSERKYVQADARLQVAFQGVLFVRVLVLPLRNGLSSRVSVSRVPAKTSRDALVVGFHLFLPVYAIQDPYSKPVGIIPASGWQSCKPFVHRLTTNPHNVTR